MKNILLTGSTGFIGRYLVKSLVENFNYIKCLVRESSDISNLPREVDLWYGDLTNPSTLKGITKNIDIVIHLAGVGDINAVSFKHYLDYKQINVKGTKNLLRECKRDPIKKFIYFSTLAVETDNSRALNQLNLPYEKSKFESELEVKRSEVSYLILRLPMVYQGKDLNKELKEYSTFMKFGIVPVIGKGNKKIAKVTIEKVIKLIMLTLQKNVGDGAYTVLDEEKKSLRGLIEELSDLYDKKVFIITIPSWLLSLPIRLLEGWAKAFGFVPIFNYKRLKTVTSDRRYKSKKLDRIIQK